MIESLKTSTRQPPHRRRVGCLAAATALIVCLATAGVANPPAGELKPLDDGELRVELAPYMGELQRLTHKLALSVAAGNGALAAFYAYESIEKLKEIQSDVPEYDGQPIALLIDRHGLPPTLAFAKLAKQTPPGGNQLELERAMNQLIDACNTCHAATLHEFIKITPGTGVNPFNQDFTP